MNPEILGTIFILVVIYIGLTVMYFSWKICKEDFSERMLARSILWPLILIVALFKEIIFILRGK